MTMRERMERAIDDTADVDHYGDILNLPAIVDAVLEAMRSPTPEMELAAHSEMDRHDWPFGEHHAARCWQLMIDAARTKETV